MAEKTQTNRWRCCTKGCNPVLFGEEKAQAHKTETGHRIAKWPVRSAEGKAKAAKRNATGYYDKYNTGSKARVSRMLDGHLPALDGRLSDLDDEVLEEQILSGVDPDDGMYVETVNDENTWWL